MYHFFHQQQRVPLFSFNQHILNEKIKNQEIDSCSIALRNEKIDCCILLSLPADIKTMTQALVLTVKDGVNLEAVRTYLRSLFSGFSFAYKIINVSKLFSLENEDSKGSNITDSLFINLDGLHLSTFFKSTNLFFKTPLPITSLSYGTLKDKLKKWVLDFNSIKSWAIQNQMKYINFCHQFEQDYPVLFPRQIRRSYYANLKKFVKDIDYEKFRSFCLERDSEKAKANYNLLYKLDTPVVLSGLRLNPSATSQKFHTISFLGTKLGIGLGNFRIYESLLHMLGVFPAYEAKLEELTLLKC